MILDVFAATLVFSEVISVVFTVILEVLEVILVSNPASAFVALVISAVMLAVFEVIAVVLLVMLAVLEAINVGNVAIIDELTPPTALTVEVNVPKPPPVTSPVNSKY